MSASRDHSGKTIIVGAGVAGLACAARLAGAGVEVEVFEASARVGGRVRSWHGPAGEIWELGAQVIHPAGAAELAAFTLGAEPAPRTDFAILTDGRLLPSGLAALRGIRPWELAARLPAAGPGTVSAWLPGAVANADALRVGRAWIEQEWAGSADVLSVNQTAAWMTDRRSVAGPELVVPAGLSGLVERLATGVTVHRGRPVRAVSRRAGLRVRTDDGEHFAGAVVITVPPWTLRRDSTSGPHRGLVLEGVSAEQLRAAGALAAGDGVAAVVTWSHPAPVDLTVFDTGGHGFLRCRAGLPQVQLVSKGPAASVLRTSLADQAGLIALLTRAFRWTGGGHPVDLAVADWGQDPFIGGAFSLPTTGHRAARTALAGLAGGGLVFAGEAVAPGGSAGRLHGALRSGINAAETVFARLLGGKAFSNQRSA